MALSRLEHKAVLEVCKYFEKVGSVELVWLNNDAEGNLHLDEIADHCREGIDGLIVMAANNELGTIYPINEIGNIAAQFAVPFFCDATQAIGKMSISFQDCKASYYVGSAHKFYGPRGIGVLIARKGAHLEPFIIGGGQQNGRRSGTLNVPAIVGFEKACEIAGKNIHPNNHYISNMRDYFEHEIKKIIPSSLMLGNKEMRLSGTSVISFRGIPNSALLSRIGHIIAISIGSACTSGVEEHSHVFRSLGLADDIIEGAIRVSLGKFNTKEEVDQAVMIIASSVQDIHKCLSNDSNSISSEAA